MERVEKTGTGNVVPTIIPRSQHVISRANISENAIKVLYRLKNAGFQAHLVGGGVRDLLLGREPKDFDVATDARPEQVRELFRNCRLIGRRFRLAHVHFGQEIVEVATFRASNVDEDSDDRRIENGRIVRDNVYGTIEQDAWRRDFTVNALYYNIDDFSVVDYAGGMADLTAGVIRLIGEPAQRYREDPVRMLRAVRFAAKLGFRIHPDTEAPLFELGALLDEISPARLFDETLKLFLTGCATTTFTLLRHYRLFGHLFPLAETALAEEEQGAPSTFLLRAMGNTDARVAADKPVTPAFLYAALLWPAVRRLQRQLHAAGVEAAEILPEAGNQVLADQLRHTTLPKRFSVPMREIWNLQPRFEHRTGKRPLRLVTHPRFRATYDFLLLRAEGGEEDVRELAEWWTRFQSLDSIEQQRLVLLKSGTKRRRRGRRKDEASAPTED